MVMTRRRDCLRFLTFCWASSRDCRPAFSRFRFSVPTGDQGSRSTWRLGRRPPPCHRGAHRHATGPHRHATGAPTSTGTPARLAVALTPMSLVVQKFGGTSVADADRIRAVADHVARTRRAGNDVVVVVSAMGRTTDELIRLAADVSSIQPTREVDMLLSAGERISMSLLCMALAELGVDAVSYTGSQAGIITDTFHTRAKILEIRAERLRATLAGGGVPVVAGFQGMSVERDVTTLG